MSKTKCCSAPSIHARKENPLDPSHAPYLHDGTLARRDNAIPMHMELQVGAGDSVLL